MKRWSGVRGVLAWVGRPTSLSHGLPPQVADGQPPSGHAWICLVPELGVGKRTPLSHPHNGLWPMPPPFPLCKPVPVALWLALVWRWCKAGLQVNWGPKWSFIVTLNFTYETQSQRYSYLEFQECNLFPIVIYLYRCTQLNDFGKHGALTIFPIILLQGRYYFYFTYLETKAQRGW